LAAKSKPALAAEVVDQLFCMAELGRERSYSPYSHFAVGAAILTDHNEHIPGSNVENISYGATICAERAALLSVISHDAGKPLAIAIVSNADSPIWPCGECLQVLMEFGPSMLVLTRGQNGIVEMSSVQDLLTNPFTAVLPREDVPPG
jgi:cytidine deaminase